jgi:SAM-dependent methyltransferase
VGNFDSSLNSSGDFSLILMLDVLEHMTDPVSALRYAVDLLAADGKLLITVPAFMSLWTGHDIINNHVTRYTEASFREMARGAGLQIESTRYFFHWLYPVKMARRAVEQVLGGEPRLARVPPRWVNAPLYWFSLLDNRAFSSLPLPFGTSLLVFASKGIGETDDSSKTNR